MRWILVIGVVISCGAATAATSRHASSHVARHRIQHLTPSERGAWARVPAPGWSYPSPRPSYRLPPRPDPYDDTPSYDDPSKRGGA